MGLGPTLPQHDMIRTTTTLFQNKLTFSGARGLRASTFELWSSGTFILQSLASWTADSWDGKSRRKTTNYKLEKSNRASLPDLWTNNADLKGYLRC